MRIKIDIKNKKQFWLKGGVEKKITLTKKNNNEDKIGQSNIL